MSTDTINGENINMITTLYHCVKNHKELNFAQKESIADVFCVQCNMASRSRFIIAVDIIIKKGLLGRAELFRNPFQMIIFNGNRCEYRQEKAVIIGIRRLILDESDRIIRKGRGLQWKQNI